MDTHHTLVEGDVEIGSVIVSASDWNWGVDKDAVIGVSRVIKLTEIEEYVGARWKLCRYLKANQVEGGWILSIWIEINLLSWLDGEYREESQNKAE